MAQAHVRVQLHPGAASLQTIARELRRMDDRTVKDIFRRRLEAAARPYPDRVRASIRAIPTKPEGKHTGLRERIAGCVELSSGTDAKGSYVSVWVNPHRMLPDYTTLPLYMQGVNEGRLRRYDRWRHPVYGPTGRNPRPAWRGQASHPYFYQAAEPLGRAAGEAVRQALDDITRKING